MKFGFVMPFGDPKLTVEVAREVEAAGWDGLFVWESVWGADAWATLAAVAVVTERISLGTMLTPISRMRPWDLAGKTTTVDNLSNGRVILGVGLGATDTGFAEFGEETDIRKRAELMDEGLDILTGLWKGQPFSHDGKHYTVRPTAFRAAAPPVQQPRPHLDGGRVAADELDAARAEVRRPDPPGWRRHAGGGARLGRSEPRVQRALRLRWRRRYSR
jgi:alkanesulfonate monooxygenase SsuD/methylene tetrahydromethanopterin reductase-like flavin-dependent oxidoreductase (luciferase family)